MPHRYTDVDRLLLSRWNEVVGVREAFDDLLDRMKEVIEAALQKAATAANDKGLGADYNSKRPSFWFWKREWENRRREPGVYFEVFDFAPAEFGKDIEAQPSTWLMIDELSRLRLRESDEEFGRAVRASLSPELLTKWNHQDADLTSQVLGRDCMDVMAVDRLRLLSEPDALVTFIGERLNEVMELAPAVDQALQKMTRR